MGEARGCPSPIAMGEGLGEGWSLSHHCLLNAALVPCDTSSEDCHSESKRSGDEESAPAVDGFLAALRMTLPSNLVSWSTRASGWNGDVGYLYTTT